MIFQVYGRYYFIISIKLFQTPLINQHTLSLWKKAIELTIFWCMRRKMMGKIAINFWEITIFQI